MVNKTVVGSANVGEALKAKHEDEEILVIQDEEPSEAEATPPGALDPRVSEEEVVEQQGAPTTGPVVRQKTVMMKAVDAVSKRESTKHIALKDVEKALAKQRGGSPAAPIPATEKPAQVVHEARVTSRITRTSIDDGQDLVLDGYDPWAAAREADEYLRRGQQPSVAKAQSADILVLGQKNGLLLWICILEAVVLVGLAAFIVHTALTIPARAIPATGQIEIYKKVSMGSAQVKAFSKFITQEMEAWSNWDAKSLPSRILPFLDPEIRGPYEAKFANLAREVQVYKGRQFYELAEMRYLGVANETEHRVILFYRAYIGRGDKEEVYKLDKISRRAKILVIGEVEPTAENDWGLQIIKHYELTEAQYVQSKGENPWDIAEGKPDSAKNKPKKTP